MRHKQHLFILVCSMLVLVDSIHGFSFKPISSFFGGKPYEHIIEKDYTLNPNGRINIKNLHGTILVKTGLDKRTVALKATKKASAQEHLDHMHVIEEEITPDQLKLHTAYDYEKVKGTVDYMLTIPKDANIHITSDIGDIHIFQIQGSITLATGHGDIIAKHPIGDVHATITQQGNIVIIQPEGRVQASTNKGTIFVKESTNSVSAKTQLGKIEVRCKALLAKKQIQLSTNQGPIYLYLPKNIQCSLVANTHNGVITSTQEITLKPLTTKLNSSYWKRVKKKVRGSIGKDKTSDKDESSVKLFSKQSDIKILSYK